MNENERAITLWLEALESGDFPQINEQLRSNEGFCCLGVACEVYRQATGKGDWQKVATFGYEFVVQGDAGDQRAQTTLPYPVVEWLGLHSYVGAFGPDDSLVGLNDEGVPFPEIAAIIRSRPEGLFREEAPHDQNLPPLP